MKYKRSIFSGTLLGIPALIFLLIQVMTNRIRDKLTTLIVGQALKKFGHGSRLGYGFNYRHPANIHLGSNVIIARHVQFSSELSSGECYINDDVWINCNCKIDFSGNVEIGSNCTLSEGVYIQTHDHRLSARSKPQPAPIIIEDNVWLGTGSCILPSVSKIGSGSIIGAGSVVTKDIPPNSVVAGVPAKIIKTIE
jgi:acetyltransferase-like isoleucine patch superfamily enzyme